jgi:glycosyltransferase involved in cell wall biosynthesis
VLLDDFPHVDRDKVTAITNGWDEAADAPVVGRDRRRDGRLVVLHTGSFLARDEEPLSGVRAWIRDRVEYRRGEYDVLTHGPKYVFEALRALKKAHPELAGRLLFRHVGAIHDTWRSMVETLDIADLVEFTGRKSFAETRAMQRDADVLLLTTVSRHDGRPVPVVSAKLYEYIHAEKPILVLSDPGDCCDFATDAGLGVVVPPRDVAGLTRVFRDLAEGRGIGHDGVRRRDDAMSRFSAASLARDLADVLKRAASRRGRGREPDPSVMSGREATAG